MLATCAALAAAPADAPKVKKLTVRPAADLVSTGLLGAGWLASEVGLKRVLASARCRWCETNEQDLWFSGIRAPLDLQPVAARASDVIAFGLAPLAALGVTALVGWRSGAELTDVLWDALLVVQAVLVAMSLVQVSKFATARERPFVARLPEEQKPLAANPRDNNMSFFSGHTALAFALATAAGTVGQLRGYRLGWLAWAIGLPLAAAAGVLRMVADKHWFSDVVFGAAVGAAAGYFVPTLFHAGPGEAPPRVTVAPMPMGLAVAVRLD